MKITLHQEVAGGNAGDTVDLDDEQAQQLVTDGYASAADGGGTPAKSASKADWVAHAVSQGADQGEAEGMTKADLVERYGTE